MCSEVVNSNNVLSSCLLILRSGYLSKTRFIAMSIVSLNGILVNRLQTSYEIINLLEYLIPTEYCAKNSFSFCKEVQEVSFSNKFMISYDVYSLFTSIPLKETIDIAINLIFGKYLDLKIRRQELKKLFQFVTSETHFLFDGSYYDQIDGFAMGSSLSPVLANIFMGLYEKR